METPSFNCICGKTYRYRSGLSKHQRGSQSEGIIPCPSYANGVAESASDRALAERLIECFENIQRSYIYIQCYRAVMGSARWEEGGKLQRSLHSISY